MHRPIRWIRGLLLFNVILMFMHAGTIFAQSSSNYQIRKSVVDQGGAVSQSTNCKIVDAVGQSSPVGVVSSSHYRVASGFMTSPNLGSQLPNHWTYFANTGNNATVVLPITANPNIDGVALAYGDYIGVFTTTGLCCGWAQWQGQNLTITAWGDDQQTAHTDGFQAGELVSYRVYRLSTQKEWTSVSVSYSEGTGSYTPDAYMVLSQFDVSDLAQITLDMNQGWNMFSINVNPVVPGIGAIMAPIVAKLRIVKNWRGQTYLPEFGINDIGDINFTEGYKAYLTETGQLGVSGNSVSPSTPVQCVQGWSMVSYLPGVAIDAPVALASIDDHLKIAKNNQGQTYLPEWGINDIGEMLPGQGYQIYLSEAASLIYPASGITLAKSFANLMAADQRQQTDPEHFYFTANTGENATVVVPMDAQPQYSDSTPLESGDEIGVFTSNGLCGGAIVWQGVNAALTVWGDDSQTDSLDGFTMDDTLNFRIWDKSDDVEYRADVSFRQGDPVVYQPNNVSVIATLMGLLVTDVTRNAVPNLPAKFELYPNFPNPFNPETVISYQIAERSLVILRVYNLLGQEIRTLVNDEKPAGSYEVAWDGKDAYGRRVASGVYLYRIEATDFVEARKMVLLQ